MTFKGRKSSNKSPPFFSHEFVIQNHADIVSCAALVFVIGLMVQATSPYAYIFIALHHNVSTEQTGQELLVRYTYGLKDVCATFFYFLICIVVHAIIQEYILDKISKRLHLSKGKQSQFNESGQLLCFYVMSVAWGVHIILKENYLLNLSSLWEGYPHREMTFMFKFFYIIQICYWLHTYPELYFQKVKKEDIFDKVSYATVAIFFIASFYLFNFTRVGVCLLVVHYLAEVFNHISALISFVDKEEKGKAVSTLVTQAVFVLARLTSVILAFLIFWFGLANSNEPSKVEGDFNTPTIRIGALTGVVLLQVYLMFNFITDLLRQIRETSATTVKKLPIKKPTIKKKELKKVNNKEYDELPEVDQNTKKNLKQRNQKVKY